MTRNHLLELMDKHRLTREDLAAITGKSTRQAYSWTSGLFQIPRSLALILYALDEGKIEPRWIIQHIKLEH